MIGLKMKNFNTILIKKQQKYLLYEYLTGEDIL